MNLEQLLSDFNKEAETEESTYRYGMFSDFAMWLSYKGYRLNDRCPMDVSLESIYYKANDYIDKENSILTHVKHEIDVIQFMQDKGMTFKEMRNLTLRLQDELNNLK